MTPAGLRKSLEWLLCVALAPALVAVAILALPLVLLSQAWDFARLRWYCWRRGAWDFLVCSPRGGWHQFIENNLARALPGGLTLVWTTEGQSPRSPLRVLFSAGVGRAKPYLARVGWLHVTAHSLHNRLQTYKARSGVDAALQNELQELLLAESRQTFGKGDVP